MCRRRSRTSRTSASRCARPWRPWAPPNAACSSPGRSARPSASGPPSNGWEEHCIKQSTHLSHLINTRTRDDPRLPPPACLPSSAGSPPVQPALGVRVGGGAGVGHIQRSADGPAPLGGTHGTGRGAAATGAPSKGEVPPTDGRLVQVRRTARHRGLDHWTESGCVLRRTWGWVGTRGSLSASDRDLTLSPLPCRKCALVPSGPFGTASGGSCTASATRSTPSSNRRPRRAIRTRSALSGSTPVCCS
jgi:hypothetical protein